jgi:hypothetical protein
MTIWDVAPPESPTWTWLTQSGAVGVLATGIIAFARGWVVPGTEYRRVCQERDAALAHLSKFTDITLRSLEVAERKSG